MVFCYSGEYQIDDWQFSDPSVSLPERQSDDDPVIELLTSEVADNRMEEAEDWDHVYGVPLESISPLNGKKIDLLIECVQRVYSLHNPESEQVSEDTPLEEDSTIPEEPVENAPVTANWLFENFRETIVSLQVRSAAGQSVSTDSRYADASCRHEFIDWLTKFMSRFE